MKSSIAAVGIFAVAVLAAPTPGNDANCISWEGQCLQGSGVGCALFTDPPCNGCPTVQEWCDGGNKEACNDFNFFCAKTKAPTEAPDCPTLEKECFQGNDTACGTFEDLCNGCQVWNQQCAAGNKASCNVWDQYCSP